MVEFPHHQFGKAQFYAQLSAIRRHNRRRLYPCNRKTEKSPAQLNH